jgi:hypothetical protein
MKHLLLAATIAAMPIPASAGVSTREAIEHCYDNELKGNLAECIRLNRLYKAKHASMIYAIKTAACLRKHGATGSHIPDEAWLTCGQSREGLKP